MFREYKLFGLASFLLNFGGLASEVRRPHRTAFWPRGSKASVGYKTSEFTFGCRSFRDLPKTKT